MEDTEKSSSGFSSDSGVSCSKKSSFEVPSDDDGKKRMPSSPLGWPIAKIENPKWTQPNDDLKSEVIDTALKPVKTVSGTSSSILLQMFILYLPSVSILENPIERKWNKKFAV